MQPSQQTYVPMNIPQNLTVPPNFQNEKTYQKHTSPLYNILQIISFVSGIAQVVLAIIYGKKRKKPRNPQNTEKIKTKKTGVRERYNEMIALIVASVITILCTALYYASSATKSKQLWYTLSFAYVIAVIAAAISSVLIIYEGLSPHTHSTTTPQKK